MNEQLTARQITEWEVYNRLDPIGEDRADFRMAVITSTIMNVALSFGSGGKGKPKPKYTTVSDFLPKWGEDKEQSEQQISDKVRNVFMGMSPTRRRRKRNKE